MSTDSSVTKSVPEENQTSKKDRFGGAVFLALVTGVSAFCGFGFTLAAAKRQHPNSFTQGFETGTALATRALGWGTIYAIGGVGALTFIVWKLLGVHSLPEFRQRMERAFKSTVPDIPRTNPPGRSDFASIRELFEYLSTSKSSEKSDKN